jgi:hypothetical protein
MPLSDAVWMDIETGTFELQHTVDQGVHFGAVV